jgi:GNAT superfamily N-acetyltransferase
VHKDFWSRSLTAPASRRAHRSPLIELLDELAANATGATTFQVVDGWLVRAAPDFPFRRTNSVFPNAGTGPIDDARLAVVAEFYRARRLPVRYQVSPAARPDGLDDHLARAGYEIEAPVDILVADVADVLDRTVTDLDVTVAPGITDEWAHAYGRLHSSEDTTAARIEAYGRLMRTVGPRTLAATLEADGGPAGIAFGVVERGWVGIYGMATRPDMRRRHVATALLHALARAAAPEATKTYLQLEVDNDGAHACYARAGYTRAYGYHYRVRR